MEPDKQIRKNSKSRRYDRANASRYFVRYVSPIDNVAQVIKLRENGFHHVPITKPSAYAFAFIRKRLPKMDDVYLNNLAKEVGPLEVRTLLELAEEFSTDFESVIFVCRGCCYRPRHSTESDSGPV